MGYIFSISVLILLFCLIIVISFLSFKKKTHLGNLQGDALIACFLLLGSYALNVQIDKIEAKEIFCSLQFVFADMMLFITLLLVYEIAERKRNIIAISILGVGQIIDATIFLTNRSHHLWGNYSISTGRNIKYAVLVPKTGLLVSIIYVFIMLSLMVFALLVKIRKSSKLYRTRYVESLIIVLLMVALLIYSFTQSGKKYGLFAPIATVLVLSFYYVSYCASPLSVLKQISSFVDSNILDGIIIFDHHGKLLRANNNAVSLFESKAEMALKDELLKKFQLEDKETVVWKEIKQNHYEIHYKPIYDDKNIFVASVFTFHDITENVSRIEKEHKMATFDQLSNSFNRSGFLEACRKVLEDTENDTTYALLISGIVNFKGINSLYGSNFGDKVLIGMAESLHSLHHKFEMIYGRTAEGKFTSLIPFEYVDTVVEELSKLTVEGEDHSKIHIDICNGFVVMNDKKRPIGYYYERALLALDKCKKKVDTPVLEYTKEMAEEQRRYQLMREEMRAAIDKKEFFIVLQPQIDMKENKVCGAEALVRWNHPILGLVFPGDFIPLFEDNGYITKLDRYVWEETASTIREFMDRGVYDGHISINVSRVDIMSFDVCDFLINLVEKYKIPVEKLHVEVTESALVNGKDSLVSTLEKLREYGFIVEIDDFGSGYSSLNSLMHIPFDVVKLDMVFMRELTKAEKDEIIIGSIAKMIHDLHASIVVEGVENQDNVDMIHRFKGDVSQGYFYSKPIPKEIFLEYVSNFK